jgi:hypothetical protein
MIANNARMVVHYRAKRFLVSLEISFASLFEVPLKLEHESH